MDYPFLAGAVVLGIVWAIGSSAERWHIWAKISAVLCFFALAAHSIATYIR